MTDEINRRKFVAALSAMGGVGLAGCGGDTPGDDGGDRTELGERLDPITIAAISGLGSSEQIELGSDHVRDVLEEDLGVPAEISFREYGTFGEQLNNDAREWNFHIDYHPPFPFWLDPNRLLVAQTLQYAGANGNGNKSNYASCEYTRLVDEQQRTSDPDERRRLIHEAESVASGDVHLINLHAQVSMGAYRSDQIEVPEIGKAGITSENYEAVMWESRPLEDNEKIVYSPVNYIENITYQVSIGIDLWSHGVYSSLAYFDKNLELHPGLATDWEVENEGERITFHLRDGATFHNGDPVTAEDVKWTHEFIDDNYGTFAMAESWPYDSIEAIDEHTVEFNFTEPSAHFLRTHVPMWGILPSDLWIDAGAEEDPENPDIEPDEIVGSGPYQVANFQPRELLDLRPYDDHWIDVEGTLVFRGYNDLEAARRAFTRGEINVFPGTDTATVDIIEEELPERSVVDRQPAFMPWWLVPQTNFGPTMFREFRLAVSHALDRSLLNELTEDNHSEPQLHSSNIGETHPFYPDDPDEVLTRIADSPAPDVERARQILEDAGWGWDDSGNLHYPPDADLEPLWPEGSDPMEHPDRFPCVEDLESA